MRALITGGTGFTGTHLVRRLCERGHEVTVLDVQRGSFTEAHEARGVRLVLGSVLDADLLRELFVGQETVFHLAAAFRQISEPERFYRDVNVTGTRNVLDAAKRAGVGKVVYCSTSGVHGGATPLPWNEDSPIRPDDTYQQTKWEGEQVCREFIERGMDITIIRSASHYGPGDMHGLRFLFRLVQGGRFLMFGDGRVTMHPLYIDNLMDAFELVARRAESRGRIYLVADESPVMLNELVLEVGRALGVDVNIVHIPFYGMLWTLAAMVELGCKPFGIKPPLFRRRVHWFRNRRAYSIDRVKQELGYRPRVGLEEGLRATAAWYREVGAI